MDETITGENEKDTQKKVDSKEAGAVAAETNHEDISEDTTETRSSFTHTIEECKVTGFDQDIYIEDEYIIEAEGIGTKDDKAIEGDIAYLPSYWSFVETPTDEDVEHEWKVIVPAEMLELPKCYLYVFFEKFVFDGKKWNGGGVEAVPVLLHLKEKENGEEEEVTQELLENIDPTEDEDDWEEPEEIPVQINETNIVEENTDEWEETEELVPVQEDDVDDWEEYEDVFGEKRPPYIYTIDDCEVKGFEEPVNVNEEITIDAVGIGEKRDDAV